MKLAMILGKCAGTLKPVILALGILAGYTLVAAGAEDCIPFNPNTVQAKQVNGTWKVVDGDHWILDFGTLQANANKAVSVIQFYHLNQICFVGRPNPPMTYFKTASGFPQGALPGQDAIPFDPSNVKAEQIGGNWKVTCCDMWMLDFGPNESEAQEAVAIIQNNHLRYQCFVGRPHAPMMYFLTDPGFASAGPCFRVRKNIAHLSASEIATLRQGVAVMLSRSSDDPTSWTYQANMHGANTTPAKPLWNQCQHGSFYFLSWHRMYLYYFERILRAASGSPDFTLPYWDYTDTPNGQFLPEPFRSPADNTNPLFVSNRNPSMNSGAGQLPPSATDYSIAFADTEFESPTGDGTSFGGQEVSGFTHFGFPHGDLEGQPHDIVHVNVGGLMSNPNTAAQDPIFWLHHCNIDRLWEKWLRQGGGRNNPTADNNWMNTTFTFYDFDGTQVSLTGAQVLNTAEQLGYIYEDQPTPLHLVTKPRLMLAEMEIATKVEPKPAKVPPKLRSMGIASMPEPLDLMDKPVSAVVKLTPVGTNTLLALRPEVTPHPKRMLLQLKDIRYESGDGVYYEIYLNPKDISKANYKDPNYVGALALFGFNHEGMNMPALQNYDVTRVVTRMIKEGLLAPDQPITVVLIPRGLNDKEGKPLPIRVTRKARLGGMELLTE